MLVMERNTKSLGEYTLEELKELDYTKIELEKIEQLDHNENISSCDCLGFSGYYIGYKWLLYTLTDRTEINIYYR